jgi:serine/threonine protein phosphatase PrpC
MAHAGDSRGMLYRNGKIIAKTLDHAAGTQHLPRDEQVRIQDSLSEAMFMSDLDPYDLPFAWQRNIVGQCLDGSSKLQTSYFMTEAMPRDIVLLSSDGIHDNLTTAEIEAILATRSAEIPELLIDAAQARSREPKDQRVTIDGEIVTMQLLRPKADDMTAAAIIL